MFELVIKDGPDITFERAIDGTFVTNCPYKKRYHSFDFEIGYCGSGPADLALNILLLFTSNTRAFYLHQDFKRDVIAGIKVNPGEKKVLTAAEIKKYIKERSLYD